MQIIGLPVLEYIFSPDWLDTPTHTRMTDWLSCISDHSVQCSPQEHFVTHKVVLLFQCYCACNYERNSWKNNDFFIVVSGLTKHYNIEWDCAIDFCAHVQALRITNVKWNRKRLEQPSLAPSHSGKTNSITEGVWLLAFFLTPLFHLFSNFKPSSNILVTIHNMQLQNRIYSGLCTHAYIFRLKA